MSFAGLTGSQLLTLFGGLGGAMVLLYILKLRRRRVEVPFSPLWARVTEERQSSSLFKALKRIFSLLIQLCILAAIIIAMGDPKVSGMSGCNYESPKPPPTRHTVLMLDASASMSAVEGGETRVKRARARAHKLIDELGENPNHRAMILQFDGKVRPLSLWSADRKALHAAVDRYAVTGALDTATNIDEALKFADAAIRGRDEAEVVIVSDRGFAPVDEAMVKRLKLSVEPLGKPGANVALEAFNVRPYLDDSLSYAIFYAIRNEVDRPVKATLFLYANEEGNSVEDFADGGNIVGSYSLTLPAGAVHSQVLDNISFAGARIMAKVEIDAEEPVRDLLPRDDVAFAIVPERKKLKIQLVSKGNNFLHATLFVRENVDFELVDPEAYKGPENYDVTIVDGVNVDISRPGAYFVIDPQPDNGEFEFVGVLEEPDVKRVKTKHPIARNLKLVDLNIAGMRAVKRQRGDTVVVAAQEGAPLLMTRTDAATQRKFVVLGFDIKNSLLPLNYAFPLLVVNVLNWFYAEDDALLKPNRAGTRVSVAYDVPGSPGDEVTVIGPKARQPVSTQEEAVSPTNVLAEGVKDPPSPKKPIAEEAVKARRVGDRLLFSTDRIGIYEFSSPAADKPMAVAVNLMNRSESSILPQGEYKAFKAPPKWEKPDDPWMENLWRAFLLGALALFALEWLTYNRRLTV